MISLLLEPQDRLLFPEGGPTFDPEEADGLLWPWPSVVFDAIHAGLHRAFPQVQLWEHNHASGKNGRYLNRNATGQRFGSLATAGPFPAALHDGRMCWYFPRPSDATSEEKEAITALVPQPAMTGSNSLPKPWMHPLHDPGAGSRFRPQSWWPKTAMENFLGHAPVDSSVLRTDRDLFLHEGPEAGLRLNPSVFLGALATLPLKKKNQAEGLDELFRARGHTLLMGGGQRACHVLRPPQELFLDDLLPVSAPVTGNRVKWLLLSPAIFPRLEANPAKAVLAHPGGWLPNWVCPATGQVLLRKGDIARAHLSRESWRKQVAELPPFHCRLIAASVPTLIRIAGWTERRHLLQDDPVNAVPGPKPVYRAVPAGAVYYFEGPDAPQLSDRLSWHGPDRQTIKHIRNRRSALLGEKGFGLGVCGPWDYAESR